MLRRQRAERQRPARQRLAPVNYPLSYFYTFRLFKKMLICKKTYRDIPFAHRQHCHDGHCAFIHGHNWGITLTFACSKTDSNGFVVDFGKLKYLKTWIDQHLDHACLFNADDPETAALLANAGDLFKPYILPNCSCEGIAQHLHGIFDQMVRAETSGRVWVTESKSSRTRKIAPLTAPSSQVSSPQPSSLSPQPSALKSQPSALSPQASPNAPDPRTVLYFPRRGCARRSSRLLHPHFWLSRALPVVRLRWHLAPGLHPQAH